MRERIRGYADAVLETLAGRPDRPQLERLAGELAGFEGLLTDNDDLAFVLTDPGLAAHVRRAVLEDLLRSSVLPETLRLLGHVAFTRSPSVGTSRCVAATV